jgi:hypothetical protein
MQAMVGSTIGDSGQIVYAGKSPEAVVSPWPTALESAAADPTAMKAALTAAGGGYADATYQQVISMNDAIFALRTINGPSALFPVGA